MFIKLIFFSRTCCNVQIFCTKQNELGKPTSKTEINSKILPRIVSNFLKKAVVWVSCIQPEELLRITSWENIQGVSEQTFKNWNLFQRNHFSTLNSRIFPGFFQKVISLSVSLSLCLSVSLSLCLSLSLSLSAYWWESLGKVFFFFFFWRVFFSGKTFFQLGYQFGYHQMNYWLWHELFQLDNCWLATQCDPSAHVFS